MPENFINMNYSEKLSIIKLEINNHFEKHKGTITAFKDIIHYALRESNEQMYYETLLFTIDGGIMPNPPKNLERMHGRPGGMHQTSGCLFGLFDRFF